ncbi:MAG: hypothetical protein OXF64_01875 [bacterium]|nr:hypothetical protein [bacterium]MCY4194396.1 hypothetical protein [bacterium]MCY4272801.1 hypothetical protein [bacterium]
MKQQLALLEAPPDWRIDERTKEIGRRGLAQARAALHARGPASQPAAPPPRDIPRAA